MLRIVLFVCAALFIGVARADVLTLVQGNCSDSARLVCPLAFSYAESVCPPAVLNQEDPCIGAQSSCCPTLEFSSPQVALNVAEYVIDSVRNPFAAMQITLSGHATVRYDGSNRVLALSAGQTLTFNAPATAPFVLFALSTRALGASRLRILGAGQSHDLLTTATQPFYIQSELLINQAPEITLLNQGASDVLVQMIDLCMVGAKVDTCGVCNGRCGNVNGDDLPSDVVVTDMPRKPVTPFVVCARKLGDNECYTLWGFDNPNDEAVEIPIGKYSNRFDTQPWNRGQPTVFPPGRFTNAFWEVHYCKAYKERRGFWMLNTTTLHHGAQVERAWWLQALDNCKNSQMPPP